MVVRGVVVISWRGCRRGGQKSLGRKPRRERFSVHSPHRPQPAKRQEGVEIRFVVVWKEEEKEGEKEESFLHNCSFPNDQVNADLITYDHLCSIFSRALPDFTVRLSG